MDETYIPPAAEDDLFSEGVVLSSDVPLPFPETQPQAPAIPEPPRPRVITPPEEYDRVNAVVAPDGSPLTENQIANPHLWRRGDPKPKRTGRLSSKANRINVRELVSDLSNETKLGPIEVLFYIMNADEESRHHLGLTKSDRISANLRAKCATELLSYMAPKLKSVEVNTGDEDKGAAVQIFLPANSREQGAVAEKPAIVLPQKDGVTVDLSPELARQLIDAQEEEDESWPGEEAE